MRRRRPSKPDNRCSPSGQYTSDRRKCYVHPAVIEAYLEGLLLERLQQLGKADPADPVQGLSAEEGKVLAFLRQALTPEGYRVRAPSCSV